MIKKKITKKRIAWGIVVLVVLIIIGKISFDSFQNDSSKTTIEVMKGSIEQTISETGTVKISDEIDLSFRSGGIIDAIYVEVGDNIERDKLLAKIDYSELSAQFQKANALLKSAQAQLANILAGATDEDISLTETQVENTKIKLQNKKQSLENIISSTNNSIKAVYEDALGNLNNAYLDLQGAYLVIDDIYQSYFNSNDQEGLTVKKSREDIKEARDKTKTYIDAVIANFTDENIDIALYETKIALDVTYAALSNARNACDTILYRTTVTDTDKTSIDTQKSNINVERVSIINAQQTISSTKINNTSSIDAAKAQVLETEGQLKEAEKKLAKLIAGPTKENIDLYESQVEQARADKAVLSSKINQSRLISSISAQVIRVEKQEGETANAGEIVISLLPKKPFQIKADIYEEDIASVNIGNPVKIQLIAFPDLAITGTVASIEPIDKIIDGVVYYEISIDFDKEIKGLKPGMSADIVIEVLSKDNVIIIPGSVLIRKNGKLYVDTMINDKTIEKEVKTGVNGDDNQVEIIKGLKEGEQVIIP